MTKTPIQPDKAEFLESLREGRIPPVFKEVPYGPPASCYARLRRENSFLLESIKGPFAIARYSYLGWDPYLVIKSKGSFMEMVQITGRSISTRGVLKRLRELLHVYPQRPNPLLPPFQGGAAGLFSYDFVRRLEHIPAHARDDLKLPDAHFLMVDKVMAFDHQERKAWIIVCPGVRQSKYGYNDLDLDCCSAYEEAADTIASVEALLLDKPGSMQDRLQKKDIAAGGGPVDIHRDMAKETYMDMVGRTLDYIRAGHIFQANLSQRLSAFIGERSTWDMYLKLSSINPSPFASYFDFGDYCIAGSSPERLIQVCGGESSDALQWRAQTRPIAGTRPRGRSAQEDEILRAELLLNEKERAEHIMLIDLERNDLGRVCDYGTVHVDELMTTEDYSHVIHIVSNVSGVLNRAKDCLDVVRAVFPGGTITGVPKVRCMEIIDELEPTARGPYTGSAGYIGFSRHMDLNIIIRTFVIKDGVAYVQAGAGIVADSDPEREYYESLKKAEALVKTLQEV